MDGEGPGFLHVPPRTGQSLQITGGTARQILSGEEASAPYSLWENVTAPQHGPRPHLHHGQDEDFYVLQGEVEFRCGKEMIRITAGGFVRVLRETVHSFTVVSSTPCTMLIALTPPGGAEHFWQEIGIPVTDPSSPPQAPGTTNFEEIVTIARKHGTEFVVPG